MFTHQPTCVHMKVCTCTCAWESFRCHSWYPSSLLPGGADDWNPSQCWTGLGCRARRKRARSSCRSSHPMSPLFGNTLQSDLELFDRTNAPQGCCLPHTHTQSFCLQEVFSAWLYTVDFHACAVINMHVGSRQLFKWICCCCCRFCWVMQLWCCS